MDKDSKILITGGQGFIGKKLGAYLSELGFSEVHSLAGTRGGIDLGDDAALGWAFNIDPEIVIHRFLALCVNWDIETGVNLTISVR